LYSLILRSDKPEAKAFKRWVTHDVLPTIRKTGGYSLAKAPTGQELIALALVEAQRFLAAKDAQIESMKPAVQFMADVTGSRGAIEMSQAAKIIGMGYGRNKLFSFLRENKVLRENNEPYQEYIDKGWFRLVEQKWTDKEGEVHINIKTLAYQKGIDGMIKLIRETKK
jgi:phage antirepressor YoqD-like protein